MIIQHFIDPASEAPINFLDIKKNNDLKSIKRISFNLSTDMDGLSTCSRVGLLSLNKPKKEKLKTITETNQNEELKKLFFLNTFKKLFWNTVELQKEEQTQFASKINTTGSASPERRKNLLQNETHFVGF